MLGGVAFLVLLGCDTLVGDEGEREWQSHKRNFNFGKIKCLQLEYKVII